MGSPDMSTITAETMISRSPPSRGFCCAVLPLRRLGNASMNVAAETPPGERVFECSWSEEVGQELARRQVDRTFLLRPNSGNGIAGELHLIGYHFVHTA